MRRSSISALAGLILVLYPVSQARAVKQSWVLPTDCEPEQAAVREHGDDDRTGNDTEQTITFALESPWIYRWSGKNGEYSSEELLAIAAEAERSIASDQAYMDQCRGAQGFAALNCIGWEGRQRSIRLGQLRACAYKTAAERRDQPAANPGGAAPATTAPDCAPALLAEANSRLQDIDAQIGAFLESPVGRQQGTATPALQVTMWGTRQQAAVIQQYCPEGDRFQARVADLNESFKLAQRACRQIQSRPELCEPVAPKDLLAGQAP